jgi:regulator of replication initiation timing
MTEPYYTGHGNIDVKEANKLIEEINRLVIDNSELVERVAELEKVIEEALESIVDMKLSGTVREQDDALERAEQALSKAKAK